MELEVIALTGSPSEMGEMHGEHLREAIGDFVEMRMQYFNNYLKDRGFDFERRRINRLGEESLEIHRGWHAEGVAEHEAIARGANLPARDLYIVTNMTDIRDAFLLSAAKGPKLSKGGTGEGCTTILLPEEQTERGHALVGQTWDLNPPDVDFIYAFDRKPNEGAPSFTITCSGCLSLMGLNAHGVAFGTTNIKTYGARSGVGYLGVLHKLSTIERASMADNMLKSAPLSGAHTYWVADDQKQYQFEASPHGVWSAEVKSEPIGQTNHCQVSVHKEIEGELISPSSKRRFDRVKESAPAVRNEEDFKTLFANREDGLLSINRYPEDEQGTATNAVLITEPASKRVWACRGPADRGVWISRTVS